MCENVHIILDVHATVVKDIKADYSVRAPLRLVWEGLPSNLPQLAQIAPALRVLGKRRSFELHVVTDPKRDRLKGVLGDIDSKKFLARHFSNVIFHSWDEATCAKIVTGCDLALIPIDLKNPFVSGKPANKLLLLWRMGMPVIASATTAYCRAMADVGTPELACASDGDWLSAIERLAGDEGARHTAATRGRIYAEDVHGTEAILSRWDRLFGTLGFAFATTEAIAVPITR
jgi:hypothetical protein